MLPGEVKACSDKIHWITGTFIYEALMRIFPDAGEEMEGYGAAGCVGCGEVGTEAVARGREWAPEGTRGVPQHRSTAGCHGGSVFSTRIGRV